MRTGAASGGIVVIDADKGAEIDGLKLPRTVTVKLGVAVDISITIIEALSR